MLPVREGRGPGSGVPLTAETVATFLIGLLATDSLTDLAQRTAALCSAKPSKETAKGGNTFHSDLANALTAAGNSPTKSRLSRCAGVRVTRHWRGVLLANEPVLDKDGLAVKSYRPVEYLVSQEARQEAPVLTHTVSLEMEAFWFVCVRLNLSLEKMDTCYPPDLFPDMRGGSE